MSTLPGDAQPPLRPVYPFNDPGQSIRLYEGPIGGLVTSDVSGTVELSCVPEPRLEWRVNSDAAGLDVASQATVTLLLRRQLGDTLLPGVPRGLGGGWSNGAVVGRADVPLKRIVAHWFNLPNLHGPIKLALVSEGGRFRSWLGRWVADAHGWVITFDVRPDHGQVWSDLHKAHVYVMTHVMEVRRADGTTFTASEAEPLLTGLHVGVSFALGRWAAPMLPVGEDASGTAVWEEWRAYHCDSARITSPGWWYPLEHSALAELLAHVNEAFTDPNRQGPQRLQMMLAIEATTDRGFVEQRVTTAAAGLEHLMWQTLVRGGRLTEDQYKGWEPHQGIRLHAHDLLRMALKNAKIPADLDASVLPVTARFVAAERPRQGRVLDGADVVTQIRNRLVHPKDSQESVYQLDGLLTEVWLLARHYLVLLILHELGYNGSYRDLRITTGWAGNVTNVPWASPGRLRERPASHH